MASFIRLLLAIVIASSLAAFTGGVGGGASEQLQPPQVSRDVVTALENAGWQERREGFAALRAITQQGLVLTAYRISQDLFSLDLVVPDNRNGEQARVIGEANGALLVVNGGFFAQNNNGLIYSVGYLRQAGQVYSKGWSSSGGLIEFAKEGIRLSPSYDGIPQSAHDVLQSRPMILEPGGVWAMGQNAGSAKPRTLLCTLDNGDIILAVVSRGGLSLFEAGWLLRSREEGGFFGCDAAIALDGGRSTQLWDADDPAYSYAGLSPVHNFLVVRSKR